VKSKKASTLEDFKGLKTRIYDKNGALVMEAVGTTPFALPVMRMSIERERELC